MMPRSSALIFVAIAFLLVAATAALAQGERPLCEAFYKNPDGSWTATQSVFLPGTTRVSRVGGIFRPGVEVDGIDVAAALDKACPNPATTAAQTQQPRSSLAQFADANGTIDIAGLTCASVADASESESALLLAWYNGAAHRPPAKRHAFNLARLRTTIQDVVIYCREHREQNLVRVMDELMAR
jgi:HdeA/HdeB family